MNAKFVVGPQAYVVEGNGRYKYIGEGTEATFAELRGDIDGLVMGTIINNNSDSDLYWTAKNGGDISELLEKYYSLYSGNRYFNASTYINKKYGSKYLEDQTIRFADNYDKGNQIVSSNFADVFTGKNTEKDAENAVYDVYKWLTQSQ